MLKILHVTPAFYPATHYGGPIFSTYSLANAIAARPDVILRVLTTDSAGPLARVHVATNPMIYPGGYEVHFARRMGSGTFSLPLFFRLWSMLRWADAVHLTGVYSPPTIPTLLFASLLKKPVLWSPRGSLLATANWSSVPRRRVKRLWELVCALLMPTRTILHVTSLEEQSASVARFPRADACLIANGVDVPGSLPPRDWSPGGVHRLMFIGRLHPVKALENLFEALKLAEQVTLDIYGEGDPAYTEELRLAADAFGGRIRMWGHVEGAAKTAAFLNADIFVLPSHSENFSMAVAEALAHGVPVIVSTGAPWQSVEKHDCGLWVDNAPSSLAAAIAALSLCDLKAMGDRGRDFMKRDFDWAKKSDEMVSVLNQARSSLLCLDDAEAPAGIKEEKMTDLLCVCCGMSQPRKQIAVLRSGAVMECASCRVHSVFPLPKPQELIAGYQNFDAGELARTDFAAYVGMSKSIILKDLAFLGLEPGPHLNFLDYGCGGGHFVKAATELGINAQGIDLDAEDAKFGRENGLAVEVGDYHDLNTCFGETRFDVILMMHVLEHMPDPLEALGALTSRLSPEGVLIIRVPDQESVPSKIKIAIRQLGIRSDAFGFVQPPIHLHGFSKSSFEVIAEQVGLDVLQANSTSALDTREFPSTPRYWRNLRAQKAVYQIGRILGSGGYLTVILKPKRSA